jgi:zinc D-Ala-D-Ala carboxypeptidase
MLLSKNLTLAEMIRSESAKRKGISNAPTQPHIDNMKYLAEKVFQPIRDYFNVPIHISSGYRSKALNQAIGGSNASFHSLGAAIDIDMDGTSVTNKEIFDFIRKNLEFTELINEFNYSWIHVAIVKGREDEKEVLVASKVNNKTIYNTYK